MANSGFVVLGASGWVGHYVLPALKRFAPHATITALYRKRRPTLDSSYAEIVSAIDPIKVIKGLASATVINLNRGEEESDFAIHQELISVQNARSSRYIYASSFNAVDAQLSRPHFEEDPPKSQSPYGQFKARCEIAMFESCRRPTIYIHNRLSLE